MMICKFQMKKKEFQGKAEYDAPIVILDRVADLEVV